MYNFQTDKIIKLKNTNNTKSKKSNNESNDENKIESNIESNLENNNEKFKIYNIGCTLDIKDCIQDTFEEIINTIDTVKENGYYIDAFDGFKIKSKHDIILKNGFYKIKTQNKLFNIENISMVNKYIVYIKNGIVTNIAPPGIYLDIKNFLIQNVLKNGECINPENGFYIKDDYNIYNVKSGLIINLHNGYYDLPNKKIIKIDNNNIELYNGHYLNIQTNKYYNNQYIVNECIPGMTFLTDYLILIKTSNNWKKINLLDI